MNALAKFTPTQLKQLDQQIFEAKTLGPGVQRWSQILLTMKAQGVYLAHAPTWAEFLHKHFPWTEKTVRNAIRLEEFRESQKLITETTGEPIIKDTHDKGQKHKPSPGGVLIDAVVVDKSTLPRTKPAKVVDDEGNEIPEPLLPLWNRRAEIEELMTAISKVKCRIQKGWKESDKLFGKIDQEIDSKLHSAYSMLKDAFPEVLCGICQGRLEVRGNFCKCCDSTGLQSKGQLKRYTPQEAVEMRRKWAAQSNASK